MELIGGTLRAEVRQGRGLPGQGPRRPADVLRLPRRALEACTHDQPHREHVRHGSSAHLPDQGLPVAQDGDGHGLQTMPVRSEKMEKTRWIEPSRRDHSRRQIRRWRTPGSRRRMISPYTTFDNSSQSPASWAMGSGSERASSRNFNPTICSRTGSAGRARATTRARSRDWSASSGGTSWSPSRVPRASRPSTMLSPNSAAGARRRGCGATRRPSASVSSGIVKFSCHCRLLPMMPAISALDGRVRCRWCVTAATTIPCPWPTATVRC